MNRAAHWSYRYGPSRTAGFALSEESARHRGTGVGTTDRSIRIASDLFDMKVLLERLAGTTELEHYTRSTWIAVTGTPPEDG